MVTTDPLTPTTPAPVLQANRSATRNAAPPGTSGEAIAPVAPANVTGPSPLQRQRQTARVTPDPSPVSITFLSGKYAGQRLKLGELLGVAASEISHELGASWDGRDATNIQIGSNFTRLNPRQFRLSLFFYDLEFDISHLAENLATLLEIGRSDENDAGAPPYLLLRQGSLVARPVFCTSISTTYKEPYAGDRGYKVAEIQLSFQLQAGADSEHATGSPLADTPLTDWYQQQSDQQRQQQGVQAVVESVLAPCLGSEGNRQLQQLITDGKLSDPAAIATLSPDAFVQAAIAGIISPAVLSDATIAEKLRSDLAAVLARSEPGVGASGGRSPATFAAALLSGDVSAVSADLQAQATQAKQDLDLIFDAIQQGELGEDSAVYDRQLNPTAGGRLRRFGGCGISLRQVGSAGLRNDSPGEESATLQQINERLSGSTAEQLATDLGISFEQGDRLLNGVPYASKQEFLEQVNSAGTLEGEALWGKLSQE